MPSLYFSPCPNDTFVLYALMEKKIPLKREWRVNLHDIETLNELALEADRQIFSQDIFKVSAGALACSNNSLILPCGMAYTEKAGPVFVAKKEALNKETLNWKILSPGKRTTACALGCKLLDLDTRLEHVRYDQMIPMLEKNEADAGLFIHESRFTYEKHGLKLVCDLGKLWKERTGLPLILAALLTHKNNTSDIVLDFIHDFQASLQWAWNHSEEALFFAQSHAQEKDFLIVKAHVDHFVTSFTYNADKSCFESLKKLGSHVPSFHLCHRV